MKWEVEYTDEFEKWWVTLSSKAQDGIDVVVGMLEEKGPSLPYPYSSKISKSRHSHLRELRIQHQGEPLRILYAFDPRRVAILLIGGNKSGNDRWYEENIPQADKIYDQLLEELRKEGFL